MIQPDPVDGFHFTRGLVLGEGEPSGVSESAWVTSQSQAAGQKSQRDNPRESNSYSRVLGVGF